MSRLNTMYPDDEFLKNISDMMGKLDNKNETEIKQEIEQIGYKEFYRYYKEKDVYIKQLQQENKKLNGTIQTYDILLKANVEENKQLKDNWNDLKKYVKEVISTDNELYGTDLLDKIQELEKGKNNEKISKITG